MTAKSAYKTCAVLIATLLSSCSEIIVPESDQNLNVADFEAAWQRIDDIYPVFEFKGIDWDALFPTYLARAEAAQGDEIFYVLSDLVAELKDGHTRVYTEGGMHVEPYRPPRSLRDKGAYNPNVIRNYFEQPLQVGRRNSFEYGKMASGIGYIRFSSFGTDLQFQDIELVLFDLDIAINYLSSASGLIMDVRDNGGGVSTLYDQEMGRFLSRPIETEASFTVTDTMPPATISPAGPRQYTGPIVILINGTSFSAAQAFADRMSQLGYVTLVGDTTAGAGVGFTGSMNPRHFLPSGKSIRIGWNALFRIDGELHEWNGIPPDVRVVQSKADAAGGRLGRQATRSA